MVNWKFRQFKFHWSNCINLKLWLIVEVYEIQNFIYIGCNGCDFLDSVNFIWIKIGFIILFYESAIKLQKYNFLDHLTSWLIYDRRSNQLWMRFFVHISKYFVYAFKPWSRPRRISNAKTSVPTLFCSEFWKR